MRRTVAVWATVAGVALAALAAGMYFGSGVPRDPPSGLLELALPDVDGREQRLDQWKGKVLVVNFWATWCEPCREEMPALSRLAARWQARGLTVLTVAVADNAKRVEEFLWEALPDQQTLPVLHDRDQVISRAWEARMLPTTVVLDKQHRIVARGTGAIDWDAPAIDKQLKRLIN